MILGMGIDVIELERIAAAYSRQGERFLQRLCTPVERDYVLSGDLPARLAARFAAKEAVMKALRLGWGGIDWREIEVLHAEDGSPQIRLYGRAEERAHMLGVRRIWITLSHSKTVAVAHALAWGGE